MKTPLYVITWQDLLLSLSFIALSLVLLKYWRIGLGRTLLLGTFRTFAQLTLMGYLLTFIFQQRTPWFMGGLLLLMIAVAGFEARRRQKRSIPNFYLIVSGSLAITAVVILGTILKVILKLEPWYSPYAVIPIAGMIIGNGLNTVSLTAERFVSELQHREVEIETLLSLGAAPRWAVHDALKDALQASLIPNVNAMMTVGVVQMPGVMTGQILAGIDPVIAVRYQIMIMYMWFSTATLANVLSLSMLYRQYFTARWQLRRELLGTV